MAQVAVPNDYFAKSAKREYGNWKHAVIRELIQNGYDAGADQINITLKQDAEVVLLEVTNNGEIMDENTLVNKLLSLGGSSKNSESKVGGFGAAKLICYFAHKQYTIRTGPYTINGSGGQYEIIETPNHHPGVNNTIYMTNEPGLYDALHTAITRMIGMSQINCTITYTNDQGTQTTKPNLHKGTPRREFSWGKIYTNNTIKNQIIIRANGVMMFHEYTSYDKCVIIEITGKSTDILTSNRDGLLATYRNDYTAFIGKLAADCNSALKAPATTIIRYPGNKYRVSKQETPQPTAALAITEELDIDTTIPEAISETTPSRPRLAAGTGTNEELEIRKSQLSAEFFVKNETDLKIPDYLSPISDKFSSYAKSLSRYWANLLVELHKILGVEGNFATGFLISGDNEAQHATIPEHGTVYFINPISVVRQIATNSRSLKARFKLSERDRLISIATHEVVHGMGLDCHNEAYANRLTDAFATVLKNRSKLMKCFNNQSVQD